MLEYLKKVSQQISEFFGKLPAIRKIGFIATALVVVGGISFVFIWAGKTTFGPLMTNLNQDDASNIIRILRDKRIPFTIDPTGKNISVPPENIYDLRLELSTMGLPESSTIGYEIFDKQALGTTTFVQKINQQRALEGELTRTIGSIAGVRRARVHLAIPKKSTFVEDQKEPTASVVIDVEPGITMTEKQVYGIGVLVARAVEGMDVSRVAIVDSTGKTLSRNVRDPLVAISADQLDFQRRLEEDLEGRIVAMLNPMLGEGHVVARVTAELDFSKIQETSTTYDGDSAAVRSTQKNDQAMKNRRPSAMGAPGATTNTPGELDATGVAATTSDTTRAFETTNFEIPQTVKTTTRPSGTVKKLSIAVVVDGKPVRETKEDGSVVVSKVDPWPQEKLKEFQEIASRAVGVDTKRGDSIEIRNLEFTREDFAESERLAREAEWRAYIKNIVIYALIGLIITLFFNFVVRPFIKWVTENTIDSVDTFLPQTIEELEKLQKTATIQALEETVPDMPEQIDPEKIEGDMLREKIVTMIDASPHKAALIMREWLRNPSVNELNKKSDQPNTGRGKAV